MEIRAQRWLAVLIAKVPGTDAEPSLTYSHTRLSFTFALFISSLALFWLLRYRLR